MINKLKIVGDITVYSTSNTWETYKNVISILKNKIISGEIKPTSIKYANDFDEKYYQYTNERNWGSNLDEYIVSLNSKLKAEITYYKIDTYSKWQNRLFKFSIEFDLPKNLLPLFKDKIEREFYYKCVEFREKELEQIEEKRIKEIGRELLKLK